MEANDKIVAVGEKRVENITVLPPLQVCRFVPGTQHQQKNSCGNVITLLLLLLIDNSTVFCVLLR
jgi:hypothetical protein